MNDLQHQPDPQAEKVAKLQAAVAKKAERKKRGGLSRTIKLRIYPSEEQAAQINKTIGCIRHLWNTVWLPIVTEAEKARRLYVETHCADDADDKTRIAAWREAYKLHPDPNSTAINRAYMHVRDNDPDRIWIKESVLTPITRAGISFAEAVKASRGLTKAYKPRKKRAGKVRPKARPNDIHAGLEWQLQGKSELELGGKPLRSVVDTETHSVILPTIGVVHYRDRGKQLRAYLKAGVEACEITVKRDGPHYYACIAVRGLQPLSEHPHTGQAVGIDMGVTQPLATSDGEFVTHHQDIAIKAHLERLEYLKIRVRRKYSRQLLAAAKRAGALTETGAFKKGVKIEHSNRMQRTQKRLAKIDRHNRNYRADWQRYAALRLVRESEIIVVEALTIRNMTASAAGTVEKPGRGVRAKAGLNRAILGRGWGTMRQRLKSKAEEFGGEIIEVNPAYTSQTCPECDHVEKGNRKTQAKFACTLCGYKEHADVVGAINILKRGMTTGAPPVAGRGGFAPSTLADASDAERAREPSNKSSREPVVSSKNTAGSRGAKSYHANKGLREATEAPTERAHSPPATKNGGSRSGG